MPENEKPQEEYSEEQLKDMRDKMEKFYDDEIPFLEKQFRYEELLSKIEQSKTLRLEAFYRSAHIHAQAAQAEAEANTSEKSPTKRELKTD